MNEEMFLVESVYRIWAVEFEPAIQQPHHILAQCVEKSRAPYRWLAARAPGYRRPHCCLHILHASLIGAADVRSQSNQLRGTFCRQQPATRKVIAKCHAEIMPPSFRPMTCEEGDHSCIAMQVIQICFSEYLGRPFAVLIRQRLMVRAVL
jgi:hypothetical protein